MKKNPMSPPLHFGADAPRKVGLLLILTGTTPDLTADLELSPLEPLGTMVDDLTLGASQLAATSFGIVWLLSALRETIRAVFVRLGMPMTHCTSENSAFRVAKLAENINLVHMITSKSGFIMIWSHYSINDLHQSSSFRFVGSFAMGRSLRIAFWLPCAALLLPSDLSWAWADAGPRRRMLAATSAGNLDSNGLKEKLLYHFQNKMM